MQFPAMGEDGVGIYEALTNHSSSRMRGVAWQRLMSLSNGWKDPNLWLPAMNDKDKGVRDAVLNQLRGRVDTIGSREMEALVTSSYANVRIFAGQCLIRASEETMDEFSFELLIDEDEVVRSTTIRAIGSRKTIRLAKHHESFFKRRSLCCPACGNGLPSCRP